MKRHLILLALAVMCLSPAWADLPTYQPTYWLNLGGPSVHDRSGLNGNNTGIGIEVRTSSTWSFGAGQYRNSDDLTTHYAGAIYTPWRVGPIHIGAQAGVVDGYPVNQGRPMLAAALVADLRFQRVAITTALVPSVGGMKHANTLSFMFKVRLP